MRLERLALQLRPRTMAEAGDLGVRLAQASRRELVADLKILYLSNRVESDSRALAFYVRLPNQLRDDRRSDEGHRFATWRFRPGQLRMSSTGASR